MTYSDWIGTIGVSCLLIAFGLNLLKVISSESYFYLILNVLGALLAGIASLAIHFYPFVILESVWMLVSFVALIKKIQSRSNAIKK